MFELAGSIDMFASAPGIKVKGKDKIHSYVGVLTTLLVFVLAVLFLYAFSHNMFQKTNPSFIQYTQYGGLDQNEKVSLSQNAFSVNFGLADSQTDELFIDKTYYNVSAYIQSSDGTFTPIPLTSCSEDPDSSLYGLICFKKIDGDTRYLFLRSEYQTYIKLEYTRCTNTSDYSPNASIVCATDEEITAKLENMTWQVTYGTWAVDPMNYSTPLVQRSKTEESEITPEYLKTATMEFFMIEFASDNGWLLSSKESTTAISLDSIHSDFRRTIDDRFFDVYVAIKSDKVVYTRSYDKIQDVLARVSGTLSTVILILGFLSIPYAENKAFEVLINGFFSFTTKGQDKPSRKRGKGPSQLAQNPSKTDQTSKSAKKSKTSSSKPPDSALEKAKRLRPAASRNVIITSQTELVTLKLEDVYVQKEREDDAFRQPESSNRKECKSQEPGSIFLFEGEKQNVEDQNKNPIALPIRNKPPKIAQEETNRQKQDHPSSQNEQEQDLKLNIGPAIDRTSRAHLEDLEENRNGMVDQVEQEEGVFAEEGSDQLGLSYIQWLQSLVWQRPNTRAFYDAKKEIIKNFDVVSLFKKYREIDNLKSCLLTEQQRALFDNLPKPRIVLDLSETEASKKDEKHHEIYGMIESYEGDAKRANEAYSALKSSKQRSTLDQRLLELFEQRREDDKTDEIGN